MRHADTRQSLVFLPWKIALSAGRHKQPGITFASNLKKWTVKRRY
jgi:hypothetical protein